jgi:hypothetical protein
MARREALAVLMIFLMVSGCAANRFHDPARLPSGQNAWIVEDFDPFEQDEKQCGPAALASMLSWSGKDMTPSDLSEIVFDPGAEGTLQISIVSATRRQGRIAYEIRSMEDIVSEIQGGHPVLVLLDYGFRGVSLYHYAVVYGCDYDERNLVLAAGSDQPETMSVRQFLRRWNRTDHWGLLVMPPERLPETVSEENWLKAAHGLELAGRHEEALAAYATALEEWPDSLGGLMGKANALYALGRVEASGDVLRHCAGLHPGAGPVHNNLARIMMETGDLAAAREAAERAVATGGPFLDTYIMLLEEVEEALGESTRVP